MGVRRAVEQACLQAAPIPAEKAGGAVYTLGPLIHNPQALEELSRLGITILDENNLPENPGSATVIIRAHGVSPRAEAELRRRGAAVVDATCPHVKASQTKAAALAKGGCFLFIAGEKTHAEILSLIGYAENSKEKCFSIISDTAEAENAAAQLHAENPRQKTALIGQTTISADEYSAITEAIIKHFPNTEIVASICSATVERQNSLRELLNEVDAVVIAGGKKSANTRRLLQIAQESDKPCALAETAADIPPEFYRYATVGLAAGASTPDAVIEEIEKKLNEISPSPRQHHQ